MAPSVRTPLTSGEHQVADPRAVPGARRLVLEETGVGVDEHGARDLDAFALEIAFVRC